MGTIADLNIPLHLSERYYDFNSVDEAVKIITQIIDKENISAGELFTSISIQQCSIEDTLEIVAKVYEYDNEKYKMFLYFGDGEFNDFSTGEYVKLDQLVKDLGV